jgi:hypothetical protein
MILILLPLAHVHAAPPATDAVAHTYDGRHRADRIDLTVAYLVPSDRKPLDDWRERVDYFMRRIAAFHRRESAGRSSLNIHVHPTPLRVEQTAEALRGTNPDQTFFQSTGAARSALNWPERGTGFPILLVLSDINWRELDDFTRTRMIDGVPTFEGNVDGQGRHFPGAESGGARATYDAEQGFGIGLVSADGWRVPYRGSDCVVYHEGVGHPIGLPHPEPIDNSVMGTAQYEFWINETRVSPQQKDALGWVVRKAKGEPRLPARDAPTDLFTAFTAVPTPDVPRPRVPVRLELTWPPNAKPRRINVRVQTALREPWRACPVETTDPPPQSVALGSFDTPTPVRYRVDVALADGQEVELWGYFQVKADR